MIVMCEIDDVCCILEYLFFFDFVDKQKVLIVGFLFGGVIFLYFVGEYKEKFYKVVLWVFVGNMKEIVKNVVEINLIIKEKGYIDLGGFLFFQDFYYDL